MRGMDGYMRGVNLGGWLSQFDAPTKEHFDTFIKEEDIRRIAGLGLDHVRVPVDYTVIETEDGTVPVEAALNGILRGLIRDGYPVTKGFKIADIDPRAEEYDNCFTISDKARCIAGGVLEAILQLKKERNL